MEIDRAKAVAEVAGVILESAKVEIGYMRVSGATMESEFISTPERPRLPVSTEPPREIPPTTTEVSVKDGRVQCLDCLEKFPDAKSLGIHRSRVHFRDRSLTGSQLRKPHKPNNSTPFGGGMHMTKQQRLPGTEDAKIAELQTLAEDYADIRDERQGLTQKETGLKSKLITAMKKHKKKEYDFGGVHIELVVEKETVKVKIRSNGDDEDEEKPE